MSGDRVAMGLASLANGISQQTPNFRLQSQAEVQINGMPDVLDGLSKRNPTETMARLAQDLWTDAFIHIINRDAEEQYIIVVRGGEVRAFDLLAGGAEVTVNAPNGFGYVTTGDPGEDIRMTTVADYTFVVNQEVVVEMDPSETPEIQLNEAIVYISKAVVNTTYRVYIDGRMFTFKTPEASSSTSTIQTATGTTASDTYDNIVDPSEYTWTECYNWLRANGANTALDATNNPYVMTSDQRRRLYYGSEISGSEITTDMVDSLMKPGQLDVGNHILRQWMNGTDATLRDRATRCNTLLGEMRFDIEARAKELSDTGAISSTQTTINSDTQPSTEDIARGLADIMRGDLSTFTIDVLGSCIRIYKADNTDFTFDFSDSQGNTCLVGIKSEVQKFLDLPARCWEGTRVRVVGEDPSAEDDYYLQYRNNTGTSTGVWVESRGWSQQNRLLPSTMPHVLIREADGSFTFREANWRDRLVGDDDSVPYPTFVDRTITDVFFYRNRLGFTVDESVVLSSIGSYFNFWADSAINVLDTDVIDVASTNDTVSLLRHGTVFGEVLILMADQVQFQLSSGTYSYLSPSTVQIDKTTEYNCSRICRPVNSGNTLFFVTERDNWGGVREYQVSPDFVQAEAPEITSHIPKYIPPNLSRMSVARNDGVLFLLSANERNSLYIYRYFWVGEEKVQSAWSHWTLPNNGRCLSHAVVNSTVYLVVQYDEGVFLERVRLNSSGEEDTVGHNILLDRKYWIRGTYNDVTDTTTFVTAFDASKPGFRIVAGAGSPNWPAGAEFAAEDVTIVNSTTVTIKGNHSAVNHIVGFDYTFYYQFSPQFVRETKDNSSPCLLNARVQIIDWTLFFNNSGYYEVHVTPIGRQTRVYKHTARLGTEGFVFGRPNLESGMFKFRVMSSARDTKVAIVNSSTYPSTFSAAEWRGSMTTDERRV